MNALSLLFTLITSLLIVGLPRHLSAIPLLLGAAYVPREAIINIGPASFTVVRILVAIGFIRVLFKKEKLANGINQVDKIMIIWAIWLIGSSVFHNIDTWIFRAGILWNELGCYFLFRVFIANWDEVYHIVKILCVILLPLSVLMLLEKATGENFFSIMGGYSEVILRDGHIRARGPFAHSILAGTVGATCLPMALYLWKAHRGLSLLGLFATVGIIFSCTSTGPIMMVIFIFLGLGFWKVRKRLREISLLLLTGVFALHIYMNDPVYFLMARIDLTGSSTGWHRAQLIKASIEHLGEWWAVGTDYTRHWMPTGIPANQIHTDITNHLLGIGIMGGLPLMILFIMVLVVSFRSVGSLTIKYEGSSVRKRFLIWTFGAILFGHTINFLSISLFDQSIVFLYLVIASIGAFKDIKLRSVTNYMVTVSKSSITACNI